MEAAFDEHGRGVEVALTATSRTDPSAALPMNKTGLPVEADARRRNRRSGNRTK